jgi:hypothetical protein
MADEIKTYQPGWEKHKEHKHHHHHHHRRDDQYTNSWGGWMKMRDKQAYYGLMLIVIAVLGFGIYMIVKMYMDEWRAMPHDDPTTERTVDELRIHKADERDALLYSDSLSQAYKLDSLKRNVQIETRPVYRPPRKEDTWYITQREWKDIWKRLKIWKISQSKDKDNE